jgi:hypothetical protein
MVRDEKNELEKELENALKVINKLGEYSELHSEKAWEHFQDTCDKFGVYPGVIK